MTSGTMYLWFTPRDKCFTFKGGFHVLKKKKKKKIYIYIYIKTPVQNFLYLMLDNYAVFWLIIV